MTTLRLLPDAEQLVINYLYEQTEVIDLFGDRLGTDIPPNARTKDDLRGVLQRIGGTPNVEQHLDNPRLQVRVYGPRADGGRKAARDGAAVLQAFLHKLRLRDEGTRSEGIVTDCRDTIGLQWLPDPDTGRPGFMFEVELSIHPLPSIGS